LPSGLFFSKTSGRFHCRCSRVGFQRIHLVHKTNLLIPIGILTCVCDIIFGKEETHIDAQVPVVCMPLFDLPDVWIKLEV